MENILRSGLEELGISAPEAAFARFRTYYERLTEVGSAMNLTAIEGEGPVARLHFLDSAALLNYADFSGARVVDVGTGAGLSGPAAGDTAPGRGLHAAGQPAKAHSSFIAETAALLGLENTHCEAMRAEEAPAEYREGFDIAVSRAVARLNVLCELCLPFVRVGGSFISMKAADCAEEVAEAAKAIETLGGSAPEIRTYTIPGTDVVRTAVIIKKTAPTPAKYPRRWARISKQPL